MSFAVALAKYLAVIGSILFRKLSSSFNSKPSDLKGNREKLMSNW